MKTASFLAASLLACSSMTQAVPRRPVPVRAAPAATYKPVPIPFTKFVLPNGLTLIVHEDHSRPVVAVSMWYHVGSQNEAPGRTGFAHLFEHLMFNGSEHADDDWFTYMNAIGAANLNSTTDYDRTNYFETVPTGALDRTLWLESDRMGHLLGAVTQAKLDEQRGVVQNEKRQQENSPYGAIPETIATSVYPPGHPYSWLPIGSMADLNAASLDDVKTWFKTWYGAGNTVIVLSGDIDPAAARDKVQRYFGSFARGPALKRQDKWVAPRTGERRATIQVPAPQAPVTQTWNTPAFGAADSALLDMAGGILGGGQTSRLYRRLIVQDDIAVSVGANSQTRELGGTFTISATPKPGIGPARIEQVLNEERIRFLRDGPTAEEVARYKAASYGDRVRTLESLENKGMVLAENLLYAGDPETYVRSQAQQFAATPAEIQAVAKKWLSDGVFVLTATSLSATTTVADVDRSKMPPVAPPSGITLAPPRPFALSNGLKVLLVERHSAPTVAMQLLFDTGVAADGLATPPSTGTMALRLALMGTPTRSETEISEAQERLSLGVNWSGSPENMALTFNGLVANLAPSLDLFADLLINPTFPATVFERNRAVAISGLEQQKSSPSGKVGLVSGRPNYGVDHPYGGTPTPQSLAALRVADLAAWYRRWVRPDNATLLVVGDVTEAQIRPLLESRLAAWRAPAMPLPVATPLPAIAARKQPHIYLIDHPGAEQTTVSLSTPAPLRRDPDYEALDLAGDVLGGGFLGRLNMNLRENKHWSYGASAGYQALRQTSEFNVSTSVQTDKTAPALAEIDRELREVLTTRKPTPDEVRRVKDAKVLTMSSSLNSASGVAGYYAHALRFGLGDDYWNTRAGKVEAVTPEQINAAAGRLIRPAEVNWIVVGDLAKIELDIRRLNIGQVSVIDLDGKTIR